ncbi:histidine kinase [Pseudonocardia ailaonensis]|uniref:histidine kinase n=1 Tax=Pseudonocardia ailaonensis TaxID=367279 RepID=A0ABN2MUC6_9PSEU
MALLHALVGPLRAGATYRRAVHLLLGAVLLLPYAGLVWLFAASLRSGLDPVAFVILLVLAVGVGTAVALVPGVRELETAAARALLDADLPDPARPETWSGRRRAIGWLLLNMLLGGLTALLLLYALPAVAGFLVAPWTALPTLPAGAGAWWPPLLGLAMLLVTVHLVALLGRLLAALAPRILGPSPEERLRTELEGARRDAARLAERTRLARELHDSVGHALTVTTLQAGAAAQVLDTDPEFARRALAAIEETGRTALDELDHVLGLLREETTGESAAPDLASLPDLVGSARSAGVQVSLDTAGDLGALPPPVSREAYRLVQEAVTNALRHAGQVPVRVSVRVADALRIEVENPLTGRGRPGGGRGLDGMAERAADLGGRVEAGPIEPGPAMAGPETAGPEAAGPVTAALRTAGPATAGPESAGLETAGSAPTGERGREEPRVTVWRVSAVLPVGDAP